MKTSLIVLLCVLFPNILCKNIYTDLTSEQILTQLEYLSKLEKISDTTDEIFFLQGGSQAIGPEDISLLVYNKANPDGTEINLTDASQVTDVSSFDPDLKTVFYVHGWLERVDNKGSLLIREALLQAANVNIIIVNWDTCANSIDYFVSKRCVADVGKYVGEFIKTLSQTYEYLFSDVTVVGHSLGAHIAGHIGKTTNGTLGVILGLDPAGPFFFKSDTSARLTENDAKYVEGIHTDGEFLGVKYNVGNSDFWPNGGLAQNGCGINIMCSHTNAYKYYAESITNNQFFARQCDSYSNFEDGKCDENSKFQMAGVNINTSATGNYYLKTNAESPFGMGDL